MRAVIQRVSSASVSVEGSDIAAIRTGLLVVVGVTHTDRAADSMALAQKLAGLRIFADDQGLMNRSVVDVVGSVLVVSQFTLYADVTKGRRPSFIAAAPPDQAEPLVERVAAELVGLGVATASGRFGAMMEVSLVNDGPITIVIELHNGRVVV